MLSPKGARGVEKAELNGNVDSDNNHGGSSRTYVLHRTGCSQEDDQLLRQGCEWSSSPGRKARSNALRAGPLDENSSATLDGCRWKQRFLPGGSTITSIRIRHRSKWHIP